MADEKNDESVTKKNRDPAEEAWERFKRMSMSELMGEAKALSRLYDERCARVREAAKRLLDFNEECRGRDKVREIISLLVAQIERVSVEASVPGLRARAEGRRGCCGGFDDVRRQALRELEEDWVSRETG